MRRPDTPDGTRLATRAALATIALLALIGLSVVGHPSAAGAAGPASAAPLTATTRATGPTPTPTAAVPLPSPEIIPEPNSGHAPRDAGERGGAQQTLVFFLVCVGLLTVFALTWRESRRKLAARARAEEARTASGRAEGTGTALSRS